MLLPAGLAKISFSGLFGLPHQGLTDPFNTTHNQVLTARVLLHLTDQVRRLIRGNAAISMGRADYARLQRARLLYNGAQGLNQIVIFLQPRPVCESHRVRRKTTLVAFLHSCSFLVAWSCSGCLFESINKSARGTRIG